jgi:uncharacterized protein (TIGR03067 family)
MVSVLRFAIILGAVTPLLAADGAGDPPKDDGKGDDAKKLLGKWQAVSGEWAGKPMTDKECKHFALEIDENHFSIVCGDKLYQRHTYKLDLSAKPKAIDLRTVDTRAPLDRSAIYELDGDTLKISIRTGEKRPTDFSTKKDDPYTSVYVLKRQ